MADEDCPTKDLDRNIRDLFRDNIELPDAQITVLGENQPRKFPWIAVRLDEILDRTFETPSQLRVEYQFVITIVHRGTDRDTFDTIMDQFDNVTHYLENDFTVDSSFEDGLVQNANFNTFNVNTNTNDNTPFMAVFATYQPYRYEQA